MMAAAVRPFVTYAPNDPALQKASFGRLASLFTRFNSNTELHKSLTRLVEKRNFYAHQAYLAVGGMAGVPAGLESGLDSPQQVRVEAERCLQELFEEIRQIEARFVAHMTPGA